MYTVKTVIEWLNDVSYSDDAKYIPTTFALKFINFINLINGAEGSENTTPVMHYKMLDNLIQDNGLDTINLCHRGAAKSTLLGEYLFLYIAAFGSLDSFGKVDYALYVSDSVDNGVKKMRKNLEFRWDNSSFLKTYIPTIKFTDIRWEFIRPDGTSLVVSGHGAKTGVRGTRELGMRPVLALLDDLLSDEDARSPTVISSIEDTVYKAIDYALHPKQRKIIWSGTPFNANDPLYKAVESGAWNVNAYPVCEKFPCTREEFRGSWEDRFNYDYVKKQYDKAFLSGKVNTFNQELMLRIISDEDRAVLDSDIGWYSRKGVTDNKDLFNFYITTDFATSTKTSADYSVISVWAYSSNGDWYWVDGICTKQNMSDNINDLFRLAQDYKPLAVGVEITGQQKGFVNWIQDEMLVRRIHFNLASDVNTKSVGIRPVTEKFVRFLKETLPLIKSRKFKFPNELREHPAMIEAMNELTLVTLACFKSKHDDFIDTMSMLSAMYTFKPSVSIGMTQTDNGLWEAEEDMDEHIGSISSYTV